jgi:peptidoglycan/LPS O-acetylase OafA/YrhL
MKKDESYDPRIDVIRGVAFLVVFIGHFSYGNDNLVKLYNFAPFGVVLFFCLSGFLLGRVVLKEYELREKISFSNFYLRRAFRILPLYFIFLFTIFGLSEYSKQGTGSLLISDREWLHLLTFTYNFLPYGNESLSPLPTVTWSLSIEEQIYIFFPFIALLLAKKKLLGAASLVSILIVTMYAIQESINDQVHVDRLSALFWVPVAMGLTCSFLERKVRGNSVTKIVLRFRTLAIVTVTSALCLSGSDSPIGFIGSAIVLTLIFPLILNVVSHLRDGFALRLLGKIGRISFGCYLYHWLLWNLLQTTNFAFSEANGYSVKGWIIGIVFTLSISWLSYKFIELPFLNIRRRFQTVQTY